MIFDWIPDFIMGILVVLNMLTQQRDRDAKALWLLKWRAENDRFLALLAAQYCEQKAKGIKDG